MTNEQERYTRILMLMDQCDDAETLKRISDNANSMYKEKKCREIHQLRIGDKVQLLPEFQNRRPYSAIGVIEKINITKVKVSYGMTLWTIPMTMIRKVEDDVNI